MKMKRFICLFALTFALFGCKNKKNNVTPTPDNNGNEEAQPMLVLSTNSISISEEKTYKLEATIDSSLQKYLLFWSVDDESVARVDDDGVVTAVKTGYTICTAWCGKYQARCVVEVTPYIPGESLSVSFDRTTFTLNVDDEYALNPVVKLGSQVIRNYTVSSQVENSTVVSYENSVIRALQAGESNILLTYSYLEYSIQQLLRVVVY